MASGWNKGLKGYSTKWKGGHHSEETKKKIGLANSILMKKRWEEGKFTEAQKKILKKGNPSPNKGRRGCHPKTEFKKGLITWNKGLKGYKTKPASEERKKKIGDSHRGLKHSEKSKIQMKETWKNKELRNMLRERRKTQIFPIKDTTIEIKIQDFLKQLNIDFLTHQYMEIEHGYQCDILVPSMNLVIECDGDWWHGNEKIFPNLTEWQLQRKENDNNRTKELQDVGFKVIRLWESDIKVMDLNIFKEIINNA